MSKPAPVVIVGDGIAGLAAAFGARSRGQAVQVLSRGNAGSTMYSGALDYGQSTRRDNLDGAADTIEPMRASFISELGLWKTASDAVHVASMWGVIRPSIGCDKRLLDLSVLRDACVIVPAVNRRDWDAGRLASQWSCHAQAPAHRISFEPVEATLFRDPSMADASDADVACAIDREDDYEYFKHGLREALNRAGRADAVLVGPWLGLRSNAADRLTCELGIAVGETLTLLGGSAGARFELAAQALLAKLDVETKCCDVKQVEATDDGWIAMVASLDDPAGELEKVRGSALVLACGGFVSGGLQLASCHGSGVVDGERRTAFSLSLSAPVELSVAGPIAAPIAGQVSSPFGLAGERFAWPETLSQRALVDKVRACHVNGQAVSGAMEVVDGLYVAGSMMTNAIATMWRSMTSGLAVGFAAGFAAGQAAAPRTP